VHDRGKAGLWRQVRFRPCVARDDGEGVRHCFGSDASIRPL